MSELISGVCDVEKKPCSSSGQATFNRIKQRSFTTNIRQNYSKMVYFCKCFSTYWQNDQSNRSIKGLNGYWVID